MKNGDKPAYPTLDKLISQGVDQGLELKYAGVTKREMFAMAAMQSLINRVERADLEGDEKFYFRVGRTATIAADQLLKALES